MKDSIGTYIAIAGLILTLLGGLWKASAWVTAMNDRVYALEHEQMYYHGLPTAEAKR